MRASAGRQNMNIIEQLKAENKDLNKVYADVVRADGKAETVDLSAKFCGMTAALAAQIRESNAKKGTKVVRIYRKVIRTNISEIERRYNNVVNEGGEGYVPDMTNHPALRAEVFTEEF